MAVRKISGIALAGSKIVLGERKIALDASRIAVAEIKLAESKNENGYRKIFAGCAQDP